MASESGWNLWVWLVGVVVRRYRFPHSTYPYSSCIYMFFCSSIPNFSFKKCFLFLYIIIIYNISFDWAIVYSLMYINGVCVL